MIFCTSCTLLFRFTARVTEFLKVLDDINSGHYERTMVNGQAEKENDKIGMCTIIFAN